MRPTSDAEAIFEAWLDADEAGAAPAFDELLTQHASAAAGLARLYADWRRAALALEGGVARGRAFELRSGGSLGPYRLVRELGRGGQGAVWEAEDPVLGRRVALKVLRAGHGSERERARFRREAQAGARVRHPGVVTVHDFGEADGAAWIAMELVPGGRSLRDFIQERRDEAVVVEDWHRRVAELVRAVAAALAAAHEAGVLHRDVKPQNILLTPNGEPKVGDFGLARVDDLSAVSRSGERLGTYLYMSPEQVAARSGEIDHRTDVFSLGVVLYELLTLRRPFEGDTVHQICARILSHDPPDPRSLRSQVPLDLAVICAKAMQKDRHTRYESMVELAADVERHLASEPIRARPASRSERMVKWSRRHPARSAAAAIGLISVAIISVLLVSYLDRSRSLAAANLELLEKQGLLEQEKAQAEEERDRLRTLVDFQRGLFEHLDAASFGARTRLGIQEDLAETLSARGRRDEEVAAAVDRLREAIAPAQFTNIGVRAIREEILEPARTRVLERFEDDPLTRASLQYAIADVFCRLGVFLPSLELLEQSLHVRRELLGDDHPETLSVLNDLGRVLSHMGRNVEARERFAEALERSRGTSVGDAPELLILENNMGSVLYAMGEYEAARAHIERALEGQRRILGADHPATLETLGNLGSVNLAQGRFDEAMSCYQQTLQGHRRMLGDEHLNTLTSLNNVGQLLERAGRLDEALPYAQEALALGRRLLGDDHVLVLRAQVNLGQLLERMHRWEDALSYLAGALEISRRVLGGDHPDTLRAVNALGQVHYASGRFDEAMPYFQEALDGLRRMHGEDHPDELTATSNMSYLLRAMGRLDEAMIYCEDALERSRLQLGDDHPTTLHSVGNMSTLLLRMGLVSEARELLEPNVDQAQLLFPPTHATVRSLTETLAQCYDALHEGDPAAGFDARAAELRQPQPTASD